MTPSTPAEHETASVMSPAPEEQASSEKDAAALKVLFVTNMYPDEAHPASGAFVGQQAEHLRKAGHQVDVLHIAGGRSRLRYLTALFEVFARTRSGSYDVVHAHYGLSGFPALFRYRTPLVITLHGSDALVGYVEPWISKMVCAFADAVIVVSKGISARIGGEIIPCGIDMEIFRPLDRAVARLRLGLPERGTIVLFPFDRERKIKRYALARAAVEALRDPGVQLVTVSGKPNQDMPWYYNAADAMILCSESEGSPTSVKEALACNIPVVSTDVGDVREIMQGIEGCEICPGDATSLAEALQRALRRSLNEKPFSGRVFMLRYDQSRVVEAIVKVYRRAIRKRFADARESTPPPELPENHYPRAGAKNQESEDQE